MKAYKLSLIEIDYYDYFSPLRYKELKQKYFVIDNQTKDTIFNEFVKILPMMCKRINENDIEWTNVETDIHKIICR